MVAPSADTKDSNGNDPDNLTIFSRQWINLTAKDGTSNFHTCSVSRLDVWEGPEQMDVTEDADKAEHDVCIEFKGPCNMAIASPASFC